MLAFWIWFGKSSPPVWPRISNSKHISGWTRKYFFHFFLDGKRVETVGKTRNNSETPRNTSKTSNKLLETSKKINQGAVIGEIQFANARSKFIRSGSPVLHRYGSTTVYCGFNHQLRQHGETPERFWHGLCRDGCTDFLSQWISNLTVCWHNVQEKQTSKYLSISENTICFWKLLIGEWQYGRGEVGDFTVWFSTNRVT